MLPERREAKALCRTPGLALLGARLDCEFAGCAGLLVGGVWGRLDTMGLAVGAEVGAVGTTVAAPAGATGVRARCRPHNSTSQLKQ